MSIGDTGPCSDERQAHAETVRVLRELVAALGRWEKIDLEHWLQADDALTDSISAAEARLASLEG